MNYSHAEIALKLRLGLEKASGGRRRIGPFFGKRGNSKAHSRHTEMTLRKLNKNCIDRFICNIVQKL